MFMSQQAEPFVGRDREAEESSTELAHSGHPSALLAPSPPTLEPRPASYVRAQHMLRPGARVPVCRYPHSWREEWRVEANSQAVLAAIGPGLDDLSASPDAMSFIYRVHSATKTKTGARIWLQFFTKIRWLDVAVLTLVDEPDGSEASTCFVRYTATGICPLTVFGAPCLNVLCCLFPFGSGDLPRRTLEKVRQAIRVPITVTSSGNMC
mmetsp:Transcript_8905/g.24575  ORF Transcript_8905/g.24575 Transcript_8905/m.24575 type:complete len:209 (-) Transcript_8905:1217-1843(-)